MGKMSSFEAEVHQQADAEEEKDNAKRAAKKAARKAEEAAESAKLVKVECSTIRLMDSQGFV